MEKFSIPAPILDVYTGCYPIKHRKQCTCDTIHNLRLLQFPIMLFEGITVGVCFFEFMTTD